MPDPGGESQSPTIVAEWDEGTSLSDRAHRQIEEMIVRQELPPGSVVSKQKLSRQLGIGVMPIREALQMLERDGLVAIVPRRGVIVTELNPIKQMRLLEVRRDLERLVARLAAERATPDQRVRMLNVADEVQSAAAVGDDWWFIKTGWEYHHIPVEAAQNEYVEKTLQSLHGLSRRYWHAYHRNYASLTEAAKMHAERLRAIAGGDPADAVAATDRLMDFLEAFVRATLEPSRGAPSPHRPI